MKLPASGGCLSSRSFSHCLGNMRSQIVTNIARGVTIVKVAIPSRGIMTLVGRHKRNLGLENSVDVQDSITMVNLWRIVMQGRFGSVIRYCVLQCETSSYRSIVERKRNTSAYAYLFDFWKVYGIWYMVYAVDIMTVFNRTMEDGGIPRSK